MRFALSILLLTGCAHRGFHTEEAAEADFLGHYTDRMSQGCEGRFTLELRRSGMIVATSPGIHEVGVVLRVCDITVPLVLDCGLPGHGFGWSCGAHELPDPAGLGAPHRAGRELGLVLETVAGLPPAPCQPGPSDATTAPSRIRGVPIVVRRVSQRGGAAVRSAWEVSRCGNVWTFETTCTGRDRRWDCALDAPPAGPAALTVP